MIDFPSLARGFGLNQASCSLAALCRQALTVALASSTRRRCGKWQCPALVVGLMWRLALERAEKREVVASLQQALGSAGSIVVAQNAGLSVADLTALRVQIKQAGGHLKVAKNRLAKLALKETDTADIAALFTGPTIIAYAEDPVVAPKIASKFAERNQKYVILGGALGASALDAENVKALATLPSLDELRAKLAGLIKQPATKIASVVVQPGAGIARVLAAYADKDKSEAA
jgi:large subunit ribosomal protein L10